MEVKFSGILADLNQARRDTNTAPSEAQIRAGNYAKGKVTVHGMLVSIENPVGSTRSGVSKAGVKWSRRMKDDYGYFLNTRGKDKDHVDVFIGPHPDSKLAYVVDQYAGDTFDEHKVILGARDEDEARKVYLRNYSSGWDGLGAITEMTVRQLRRWLYTGVTTRPLSGQKIKLAAAAPTTGPEAVLAALRNIDLDALEKEQREIIARGAKTKRARAVRALGVIRGLRRNELRPEELMINKIPVLPPMFRPFTFAGSTFVPGDANELYGDLDDYRKLYDRSRTELGEEGSKEAWKGLRASVRALYGTAESPNAKIVSRGVSGFLGQILGDRAKTSYVQRRLLSKPLDNVSRGTIIPDPELDMDRVGLPVDTAWTKYASHIQRRLVRSGMSPLDALRSVKERNSQARRALELELTERPVLLSRSPAWHKFNVVAAWPKLVDGDAIRISPLIATGQNADYDGDECINQVYACIPDSLVTVLGMSFHNLMLHAVQVPYQLPGHTTFLFDLEDFPHLHRLSSKEGAKGPIDFHAVPAGIKVLAYEEGTGQLAWAEVAAWSKHYKREIEIVDTHNGYQLVTDDDPRAVYGVAAGSLALGRFTPTEAAARKVLIPRTLRVPAPECTVTMLPGRLHANYVSENGEGHGKLLAMKPEIRLDADIGWFLGAMVGDGWVRKHGQPAKISGYAIADNDGYNHAKLVEVSRHLFENGQPVEASFREVREVAGDGTHGTAVSYRFGRAAVGCWLQALIGGDGDLTTAGSGNKHLPPCYLSAPEDFREGLFAGLMDTDGSIAVSNGKGKPQLMATFGSTSIRLVQEVRMLAASIGISGRITPGKTPLGKPFWLVAFSNRDIQRWGGKHMAHQGKLAKLASVTEIADSAVTAKYDIVPVSRELASALGRLVGSPKVSAAVKRGNPDNLREVMEAQALYVALHQGGSPRHRKFGAISRQTARKIIGRVGREVIAGLSDGTQWLNMVDNDQVTWERVRSVQYTGIREDGYDLTVPGYETFMAVDGIILSNTMNVHVPTGHEAVKEAIDKLMPSKMPFSIKDKNRIMPALKHEQILGLHEAQNSPAKKTWRFASEQEATEAVSGGAVPLEDEVEWPGMDKDPE